MEDKKLHKAESGVTGLIMCPREDLKVDHTHTIQYTHYTHTIHTLYTTHYTHYTHYTHTIHTLYTHYTLYTH